MNIKTEFRNIQQWDQKEQQFPNTIINKEFKYVRQKNGGTRINNSNKC